MLKIFYGTDEIAVRAAVRQQLQTHKTDAATVHRIDPESFEENVFVDAAQQTSLFGGVELFIIDAYIANSEFEEAILTSAAQLQASEHVFFVLLRSVKAPERKKYEKVGAELNEYKAAAKNSFNTFALTDALLARDKKKFWLLLQEAKRNNIPAEEIIGVLFWQVKSVRLSLAVESPEAAGLKPFVYNKAKGALRKYSKTEIETMSRDLVTLYHEGHAGVKDIDLALESWVLKV